jgi:chemotaxis signal transduction protein
MVGFLVDDVAEVITIVESDIQQGVADCNSAMNGAVSGLINMDSTLISIIDMNSLVGVSE